MLSLRMMKGKKRHKTRSAIRQAVCGWALFVVCALLFMASGWRNRDGLTFIASVIFLVACLVFLIPLLRSAPGIDEDPDPPRSLSSAAGKQEETTNDEQ